MNSRPEIVRLPEQPAPTAIVQVRELPNGMMHTTVALADLPALEAYLSKTRKEPTLADNFAPARPLFFLIIAGVLFVSIAFIVAGLILVYLGATGDSEISLFGVHIKSANVGVVSIALGAVVMVILIRNAMQQIRQLLTPR